MLRASLSTSRSRAQCLPVDKPWFEFIESGFVEAIFMLLLEGTQYTHTHVSWGTSLSGEIVEVPDNTRGLRPGDRCAIEPYISCGQCRTCKVGRTNCCEQLRLIGVHVDGGMQGFLGVPIELLHKSELLSLDQLALVETLGIGAHAVKRSQLRAGEEVLVVGAGPIGLAVSQFATAIGAKVAVIEINDWRRHFAHKLGVEALATPDGRLADVVLDATGSADRHGR